MSARQDGIDDGRANAERYLRMTPRERLVRMKDRALRRGHADAERYYVGLLEGVLAELGAAVDAEAPTERYPRRKNDGGPRLPIQVAAWAEDSYEKFHWGRRADRVIRAQGPRLEHGETLCLAGELYSVGYLAKKGDEPRAIYEHTFSSPRPLLTYQHSGCLIIIGGGYRITARGIVG